MIYMASSAINITRLTALQSPWERGRPVRIACMTHLFALRAQCGQGCPRTADRMSALPYVSFFLKTSFKPDCAWSWAS
jgi:hypothetical protein